MVFTEINVALSRVAEVPGLMTDWHLVNYQVPVVT